MNTKYIKPIMTSVFTLALYILLYNAVAYLTMMKFDFYVIKAELVGTAVCIIFILYPFFFTPKPDGRRSRWESAFYIFATAILGVVINILLFKFTFVKDSSALEQSSRNMSQAPVWMVILLVGAAAPALEELVFRGVIFGQLRSAFGIAAGTILSALIFGVVHHNIPQFIYASLMGIVFALIYERTRSLITCMLAHGATNLAVAFFSAYIGFTS